MTRRFTAQHTASGYSAMGGNLRRPRISGGTSLSVGDLIARARRAAVAESNRKAKAKK
jgi:hypothetical protein